MMILLVFCTLWSSLYIYPSNGAVDDCQTKCNGNTSIGICDNNGRCICKKGHFNDGDGCKACEERCQGKGYTGGCHSDWGTCYCDAGFRSIGGRCVDCHCRGDKSMSWHCRQHTGFCYCRKGYWGKNCTECNCNKEGWTGHCYYDDGKCRCIRGFGRNTSNICIPCEIKCDGPGMDGRCNGYGECYCSWGYRYRSYAEKCVNLKDECKAKCKGKGKDCDQWNRCVCLDGFYKSGVECKNCTDKCKCEGMTGRCNKRTGVCECYPRYYKSGDKCNRCNCKGVGVTGECYNYGQECHCHNGYYRSGPRKCESCNCNGVGGSGSCDKNGNCICLNGYFLSNGECKNCTTKCNSDGMSGECYTNGECLCKEEYVRQKGGDGCKKISSC